MTDQQPSWREITTNDNAPRIFPVSSGSSPRIASSDRVHALLQEQDRGECRLRLILREMNDLKRGPNANAI